MKKKERDEFKEELEEIKDKLCSQIEHLENNSLNKSQRDFSGDLSGYSFHMADMATDNSDQDFNLGLVTAEQKVLYEVNEALGRAQSKNFGLCEQCEKEIKHRRLKAVPYARLCIKCKTVREEKAKS